MTAVAGVRHLVALMGAVVVPGASLQVAGPHVGLRSDAGTWLRRA